MIEPPASLGWDAQWAERARAVDPEGAWQPVRIAAEHRGAYHATGPGGLAWVELPGRTFHRAADKRELPTVGDWVLVERWEAAVANSGAGVVREILPRRSFLVRKAAGEATLPQPIAANIDVGLVMTSANTDLSPARLDRYIGILRDGGIEPVLVLSKADLAPDPAALLAALRAVGEVRVLAASSHRGEGLAELRALGGPGRTTVLLGSSGVGKSTLLNALIGTRQETRDIRADERGRHTTTRRELFMADDGGLWIDTPGMRELAQWIEEDDEQAFDDIAELAGSCRFRDCQHRDEPGCAVRDAIGVDRLASFHKLAAERDDAIKRQEKALKLAEHRKARQRSPKPRDRE
ncbi:MAG: ribosome small subunit-dependent GTPase A [Kofleriaceae bacterium]|nr:ribosome small subunit-dependent GTPase A [Kofleriaceae bacterium]